MNQYRSSTRHIALASALLFAAVASAVNLGWTETFDVMLLGWLGLARGRLDPLMLACTWGGSFWSMTLLTAGTIAFFMMRHQPRSARFLLWTASGSLFGNLLLKLVFHRARPGADWLYRLPEPIGFAFPSGHSMGSAGVTLGLLVLLGISNTPRPLRIAANCAGGTFICAVGVSRVYFGAHFPSDVLGGWLAAIAWVSAIDAWSMRTQERQDCTEQHRHQK